MESHHWIMLAVVFLAGAVAARFYPAPFQKVGLP